MINGDVFLGDYYVANPDLLKRYRTFQTAPEEVIDLNHASLARPYKPVFEAVRHGEEATPLEARVAAASLVNTEPSRVLFGRNTTEALSLTSWLAGVEHGNVVITDAENPSVARIYREHRDHGNTAGQDGWSTFPDACIAENFPDSLLSQLAKTSPTGTPVTVVPFLGEYDIGRIIDAVDEQTRLVLLSHVVRNDGRIIDVAEVARRVKRKSPATYIAVDGAQALGTLPSIDFPSLEEAGIDFYAATPHKTLGAYPLGILYISKHAAGRMSALQGRTPIEQLLMPGMLPVQYSVAPNTSVPLNTGRYASLVRATKYLEDEGFRGDDFSRKASFVSSLKTSFVEELRRHASELPKTELLSIGEHYSPAILAFRFVDTDNRDLVQRLGEEGIFCSYLSPTNNIRVSFGIRNTRREVQRTVQAITELVHA